MSMYKSKIEMQSDDPKYLKRKIRSGSIDVHPTEKALIVNYELEALILGEKGDKMLGDKKEHQKIIRLNSLNARTDCAALAREVVDKCSLIHHAKLNEVEHLIRYLKNRKEPTTNADKEALRSYLPHGDLNEKPSINNIDAYVDNLYEETYEKILGSAMILQLAQNPNNLEELANNESALSALARVLREDWKKNMDLATNIVYIFNCFSAYTQFHPIIVQYKIGSLCMELIDYELRRYESLKESLEARRLNSPSGRSCSPSSRDVKKRQSMIPVGKKRSESANRLSSSSDEFRKSLPTTPVNPNKSILDGITDSDNKKGDQLLKKQDQLLRVSVNLLLNLAENTKIEEKMRKRNISRMLMHMLDRNSKELLVLCLKFLKKLSVFKENKDDMAELNIVEPIAIVMNQNNDEIQVACLRLLYNLSFDGKVRDQMVKQGLLPKFVTALGIVSQRKYAMAILYHLSVDDKVKSMFIYTDCIPLLIDMIFDGNCEKVAIALCINLALNKKCAELMSEGTHMRQFLAKAFKNQDALLMKMLHNMVMTKEVKSLMVLMSEGIHMRQFLAKAFKNQDALLLKMLHNMVMTKEVKSLMVEFVGDIAKAVTTCESEDFVVEGLGILGNLTIPELDYCELFQQFGLVPWLQDRLQPGQTQDDVVLAAVVLLGTAACDEDCAALICKSGLISSLIELLKAKQEDDEMVLQIVYVFYEAARHNASREYLIKETEAPAYLIDLMQDKNKEIAKVCDACLDIISECDADWKRRIMLDKFRFHNANWLEMVESQALDDGGYDEELPPFLSTDLMQNAMFYEPESKPTAHDLSDYDDDDDNDLLDYDRPRSRFSRELDIELIEDGSGSALSD